MSDTIFLNDIAYRMLLTLQALLFIRLSFYTGILKPLTLTCLTRPIDPAQQVDTAWPPNMDIDTADKLQELDRR